jgi:endoglucanase
MRRALRVVCSGLIGLGAIIATLAHANAYAAGAPNGATPPMGLGPLHTSGSKLLDAQGQEVRITGVNWFGLETNTFAPHGLWARNYGDMLDQIVAAGFNTVRLPYTDQLFDPKSMPTGIDYGKNPDLKGLNGQQVMDHIIDAAGKRGLSVLLDRHRPTAAAQSELWYTSEVPESRWLQDWVMLAKRYAGNPTVIGADLHNEPHGPATWGDGNQATDWRLAAQRAGNAILAVNPDWLIVVEGIEHTGNDWYWWGGNLSGAAKAPVQLSVSNKVVYSPHDYGPDVYGQKWFAAPNFPANLAGIWHDHWAFLQENNIAPVLIGEFGGRSVGSDAEGIWQRTLLAYMHDNNLSYTYWAWNPDSGDTGGLLSDDWSTLDKNKLAMLATYQWPVEGHDGTPAPATGAAQGPTSAQTPAPNVAQTADTTAAQTTDVTAQASDASQATDNSQPTDANQPADEDQPGADIAQTADPPQQTDATEPAGQQTGDATQANAAGQATDTGQAAGTPPAANAPQADTTTQAPPPQPQSVTPQPQSVTPQAQSVTPPAQGVTPGVTLAPLPGAGAVAVVPQPPAAPQPPAGGYAPGGPFDPDLQHALQGIGGPNDPDAAHRQARQRDEQLYLTEVGKPWQYAVYVTTAAAP